MTTKNAKLMEKKITKPTISKPSNTVIRKADKPRTALKELKKQYSNVNSQYQRMKSDKWQFSDLAASWYDRDRRKIQKKIDVVQKVVDKKTKPNNKDLSKSLWSVANNRWMKNADAKWTVKLAEKTLSNAKQKLRTHDASMWWTKQQHDTLKKQVKAAEKNLKSLNKTASRRK